MPATIEHKEPPPNVNFIRSEITTLLPKWLMINDCLQGDDAVKAAGDLYLPRPNAADTSKENQARYTAYKKRAVFYNVTRKTLDGMIGQVFSRNPITVLPTAMTAMLDNVDGTGVSLDQQARKTLGLVMGYGSAGLLVDYPAVDTPTTLADQQAGLIRPTITVYQRQSVINWRHEKFGAASKLTLVVIKESYPIQDDGFEVKSGEAWRVLRLRVTDTGPAATVEMYRFNDQENMYESYESERFILKGDGSPWDIIPFTFVGVLDNGASPDEPPIYDLAVLNIAHYRNSADYEDSCYLVGQPTPYFTGLTQQWVDQVLKGQIQMGSRSAVPLPSGANAGLLQVTANSMPFEAMHHKEAQMIAIGARLVTQSDVQKTLGEAQLEESAEISVLATATNNISAAYTQCLQWAAEMYNIASTKASYSLNTDFPASRLTPAERQQLVLEWQASAITFSEMRAGLRKAGVATIDDDAAKKDIEQNPPIVDNVGGMNNTGNGGTRKVQNSGQQNNNNGGNQTGN